MNQDATSQPPEVNMELYNQVINVKVRASLVSMRGRDVTLNLNPQFRSFVSREP